MIKRTSKVLSLFILALLVASFLFLTSTFSGLKVVTSVLTDILPGHLQLELGSGALTRTIVIKSFQFDNKDVYVAAENVHAKLNLFGLILNDLNIQEFSADKVSVVIKQQKKSTDNSPPGFDMPLKIAIENTSIKQFNYEQDSKKYSATQLNINGEVRSNVIKIAALQATYQNANYDLHGLLSFAPVALHVTLQQQQHQQTTLQTTIKIGGNWQHLTWHASLKAPVDLNAKGVINNILTHPSWTLVGTSKHLGFNQNMAAYNASFEGTGDAKQLQLVGSVLANDPKTDTEIDFKLQSNHLSTGQFSSSLNWQNVFWPQRRRHLLASPSGNLQLQGNLNRYTVKGSLSFLGNNIPSTSLSFAGHGNKNSLTLPTLSIATLNGNISGKGHINWQHTLRYQLQLQAQKLQPNVEWVNFPGTISFGVNIASQQHTTDFIVSSIEGDLRDKNIHGFANLQLLNNQLNNGTISIKSDDANLNANFKTDVSKGINLHWDINIPHLEALTPFLQGSIISKASYQQDKDKFTVQGTLTADNFIWQSYEIDHLNSDFDFNSDANKSSVINLEASQITLNKYYIKHIAFNSKGKNPRHRINLSIESHKSILNSSLFASYNAPLNEWSLYVEKMNLLSTFSGNWQLTKPYKVTINPQLITMDQFNWQAAAQRIKIDHFNLTNHILHSADIMINNFTLKVFNGLLPTNLTMHGKLNFRAHYQIDKNAADGKMKLSLDNARFSYPLQDKVQNIVINKADIIGAIDDNKASSQLNVRLNNTDHIKFGISFNHFDPYTLFNAQQNYHANLKAKLHTLDLIKPFMSNLDNLLGQFDANMTWDGTLKQPVIKGTASLNNATLLIAQQGLDISKINFQATGLGNQVNYLLTAHSGKGNIQVSGSSFLNERHKTSLEISGKQFEIDHSPHFHIIVSPKLKVSIMKDQFHVEGDLIVPFASIDLISYANVQTLSSDVQLIQATGKQTQDSLLDNFFANINLILGNNITLKTKFLTAQLAGRIQLVDTPKTQTNATGELTISKGTVAAFGQALTITNGKLLYAGGPTTNPGLNIKAFKQIKTFVNPAANSVALNSLSTGKNSGSAQTINAPLQQKTINVGVSVTGSLSNPQLMLYSDQADLSQADILSYLILGYPMNSATNQQGEALIQAANALSASNNDMSGLISNIKNSLDLNEIGLQSSNYLNPTNNSVEQNTSLVLGKMLSPKLFVHYSIGLIIPINTLSATYSFNHNWSLQTETNSLGNGVDLIYSWEHN